MIVVRRILSLALAVGFVLGAAGCGGPQVVLPGADVQADRRTVTAAGEAEVRVIPDEVLITLGIENMGLDLEAVRKENDGILSKAIAVAQEQGVKPEQIKTEYLSAEPRYRDSYDRREFLGYHVRRTVVITLKDLSRFESLLSGELTTGVNYIHGIDFRTTELRKHKDSARALAVTAAKEKATALAGQLGKRIGEPRTITEEQSNTWSWYSSWWGGRLGGGQTQNVIQNAGGSSASTPETVAPGQITVSARVSVTFDLDP